MKFLQPLGAEGGVILAVDHPAVEAGHEPLMEIVARMQATGGPRLRMIFVY